MDHIMNLLTCSVYKYIVNINNKYTREWLGFFLHCANGPSAYEPQTTAGMMLEGAKKILPTFLST